MTKFKYVIFDFDGTLVDTGEGILKSLQYSFRKMGHEVPEKKDLRKFIGPPVYYSYTHFYGISEDEVGDYIKAYRERYTEKGIYECQLYDGIVDAINKFKENGVKVAVASSKPIRLIYAVADYLKITDLFDAIVGVKVDDSNHSTKADLICEAMDLLGVTDKKKVLMVGDRLFDLDGASGAGVKSCGALWGYGSEEEFKAHNATFIIKNAKELENIVL